MCCHAKKDIETGVLAKGDQFLGYKVYRLLRGKLYPKWQDHSGPVKITRDGWVVSDRHRANVNSPCDTIFDKGIHVFLYKIDAQDRMDRREITIPVTCYKDDFVAAGHDDFGDVCAVYYRIQLDMKTRLRIRWERFKSLFELF
jgi:hypothetical protein